MEEKYLVKAKNKRIEEDFCSKMILIVDIPKEQIPKKHQMIEIQYEGFSLIGFSLLKSWECILIKSFVSRLS